MPFGSVPYGGGVGGVTAYVPSAIVNASWAATGTGGLSTNAAEVRSASWSAATTGSLALTTPGRIYDARVVYV